MDLLAGNVGFQEVKMSALNRRGKQVESTIACSPLVSKSDGVRGVILLVEDNDAPK
jgi:hypothetical protein